MDLSISKKNVQKCEQLIKEWENRVNNKVDDLEKRLSPMETARGSAISQFE